MRMLFADRDAGEPIAAEAVLLAGKKVRPDILGFLSTDHQTVMGWFDWYENASDLDHRKQAAESIRLALKVHMLIEEEILYPAAKAKLAQPDLIARATEEHEQGKALLMQIEETAVEDTRHRPLMKQLRDAIAQHVVEEETELFPKVLETDLDRYAVGAAAAARRTEQLFALASRVQTVTESPKETGMTPISKDEARQFFVVGLRNIHATATQCKTMVDAQLERLENYPVLEAKLQQHRIEKDQQLARVERILDGLGESRSSFKDTSMSLIGSISSMGAALADDEIFKNSFTTYGLANFEAAAYETLLLLGEAAEEYDAIPLLQESLSEERAMASFIASNLRPTGMRFLQLRSAQRQASH